MDKKMMKGVGKGYAGRISNSGSQIVKAPFTQSKKTNTVSHKGQDLRSGK